MKLAETAGAFRFGSSDGFLLRSNVWFVKEFTTTMSFVRATTDGTGVGFFADLDHHLTTASIQLPYVFFL
jgi:hypothetical protein